MPVDISSNVKIYSLKAIYLKTKQIDIYLTKNIYFTSQNPYIDHCWGGGVWLRAATLPDPGSMITLALLPHRPRVTRLHQHTGRHMQELDCYLLLFPTFRQNYRVSKKYLTWSRLEILRFLWILGQWDRNECLTQNLNNAGISFLETSPKLVMHFKCACKILMHMYYCLTYDFNYDYYFNDDSVKMRHFFIYTING